MIGAPHRLARVADRHRAQPKRLCNCRDDGWIYAAIGPEHVACSHCEAGRAWAAEHPEARICCGGVR